MSNNQTALELHCGIRRFMELFFFVLYINWGPCFINLSLTRCPYKLTSGSEWFVGSWLPPRPPLAPSAVSPAERIRFILGEEDDAPPPPQLFTELDELLAVDGQEMEWKETARWATKTKLIIINENNNYNDKSATQSDMNVTVYVLGSGLFSSQLPVGSYLIPIWSTCYVGAGNRRNSHMAQSRASAPLRGQILIKLFNC